MKPTPVFRHDFIITKNFSRKVVWRLKLALCTWYKWAEKPLGYNGSRVHDCWFPRGVDNTAVIHAILFHRVFGSVQPKDVEVLGITFPQVVESEIESLVNERTERVAIALERKSCSVMLSIRFLETRLSNQPNKEDSNPPRAHRHHHHTSKRELRMRMKWA